MLNFSAITPLAKSDSLLNHLLSLIALLSPLCISIIIFGFISFIYCSLILAFFSSLSDLLFPKPIIPLRCSIYAGSGVFRTLVKPWSYSSSGFGVSVN